MESPSNVAALHCSVSRGEIRGETNEDSRLQDGRNQVAFGACALLAYHGIFSQVDHLIRYYESKRCAHPALTLSQRRFARPLDRGFASILFSSLQIRSILVRFGSGNDRTAAFHRIDVEIC